MVALLPLLHLTWPLLILLFFLSLSPPPSPWKNIDEETEGNDRERTPQSLGSVAPSPSTQHLLATPKSGRARPLQPLPLSKTPPPSIRDRLAELGRSISVPASRLAEAAAEAGARDEHAGKARRGSDSMFENTAGGSAFQRLRTQSLADGMSHISETMSLGAVEDMRSHADSAASTPQSRGQPPVRAANAAPSAASAEHHTPGSAHASPLRTSTTASVIASERHAASWATGSPSHTLAPTPAAAFAQPAHSIPAAQSSSALRLPTLPAAWMTLSAGALQRALAQPAGHATAAPSYAAAQAGSGTTFAPPSFAGSAQTTATLSSAFQQVRQRGADSGWRALLLSCLCVVLLYVWLELILVSASSPSSTPLFQASAILQKYSNASGAMQ